MLYFEGLLRFFDFGVKAGYPHFFLKLQIKIVDFTAFMNGPKQRTAHWKTDKFFR
jgi:hypothetical protein